MSTTHDFNVTARVHVERCGDVYVARCPLLRLVTEGKSELAARVWMRTAILKAEAAAQDAIDAMTNKTE